MYGSVGTWLILASTLVLVNTHDTREMRVTSLRLVFYTCDV